MDAKEYSNASVIAKFKAAMKGASFFQNLGLREKLGMQGVPSELTRKFEGAPTKQQTPVDVWSTRHGKK